MHLAQDYSRGLVDFSHFKKAIEDLDNEVCPHELHKMATGEWECALCGEIIERD
jgi:hypothetical protein